MLQRIGLAQALINDPELVILDEPMSGLDPIGRREVRDIILDLKARGRTVFFSTHILSDTEMICDRVGMLVRGSLAAIGTIDDLVAREIPFWEVTLRGIDGGELPCGRVVSRRRDEVLVRVESRDDLQRILALCNGRGPGLVAVTPARQSLEDLFLRETRRAGAAPAAPR
jgi:ABC-2 type transport system ATP-binding protein